MKRTIISIVLLLILGGLVFLLWQKYSISKLPEPAQLLQTGSIKTVRDDEKNEISTGTVDVEITGDLDSFEYEGGGEYKPFFAQTAKDAIAAKKSVVLYFYASRDPTDGALDADLIERKNRIPKDVVILRIDFDKEEKLKKAYNITQQNTLIFIDNTGEEKARRGVGITSLSQIVDTLKEITY